MSDYYPYQGAVRILYEKYFRAAKYADVHRNIELLSNKQLHRTAAAK